MMRESEPCEICREEFDPEELIAFGDMQLCPDCLDRATVVCDWCGARIWREDNAGDNDIHLCQRCYDSHYTIRVYGCKPAPTFYGDSERYFGVELEINEGGESDDNARKLFEIVNSDAERLYAKHDGSLNDGCELVSHPHEPGLPHESDALGESENLRSPRTYQPHRIRRYGEGTGRKYRADPLLL